ncbi:hypothetical protein DIPPA_17778 [Diplonema papillatum]|nr:hypothetical protein DIPPA_17778 [Diplonema papillatum]
MGCCGGKEEPTSNNKSTIVRKPSRPPDKDSPAKGDRHSPSNSPSSEHNGVTRTGSVGRAVTSKNIQKFIPTGSPTHATEPKDSGKDLSKDPSAAAAAPAAAPEGAAAPPTGEADWDANEDEPMSVKHFVITEPPPPPVEPSMTEHEVQVSAGPPRVDEIPKLMIERAE